MKEETILTACGISGLIVPCPAHATLSEGWFVHDRKVSYWWSAFNKLIYCATDPRTYAVVCQLEDTPDKWWLALVRANDDEYTTESPIGPYDTLEEAVTVLLLMKE